MPRLQGYRERIYTDLYDALAPRAFTVSPRWPDDQSMRIKLFSNANIGDVALTNIQAGSMLPHDMAMMVHSWYARTNIAEIGGTDAFKRAWHAWANATTADFIVGGRTFGVRSLASLLMGRAPFESTPDAVETDCIARQAWTAYRDILKVAPSGRLEDAAWRLVSPTERLAWFKAATAKDPDRTVVHVPTRQSFGVTVASDPNALRALLEVMPTDVAPAALVWVHLEGWTIRDIQ